MIAELTKELSDAETAHAEALERAAADPTPEVGGRLAALQARIGSLRGKLDVARQAEASKRAAAQERAEAQKRAAMIAELDRDTDAAAAAWEEWQRRYVALSNQVDALFGDLEGLQATGRALSDAARQMGVQPRLNLNLRPDVAELRKPGRGPLGWKYRTL